MAASWQPSSKASWQSHGSLMEPSWFWNTMTTSGDWRRTGVWVLAGGAVLGGAVALYTLTRNFPKHEDRRKARSSPSETSSSTASASASASASGSASASAVDASVSSSMKASPSAAALAALEAQISAAVEGKPVVLTPETVVDYYRGLGLREPVASASPALVAEDSSSGNLNYCFIVKDAARGRSVFVKQAPDFVKCLGEDAKLTTERIRFEAKAALEFMKHAPGGVPDLFFFDPTNCVMVVKGGVVHAFGVMEHLARHQLLNDAILSGDVSLAAGESVARFMGNIHTATHRDRISPQARRDYERNFHNPALCSITDTYIFTLPFREDPSNSHTPGLDDQAAAIRADAIFLADVAAVHGVFQNKREALIHGDLHAGSIMTDGVEAKVIDHEFVFYGPAGFDVGLFLAGYIFPFAAAAAKGEAAMPDRILTAVQTSLERYFDLLRAAGLGDEVAADIFRDALGFAGCELMRRVLGVAKRKDLEGISHVPTKLKAERLVLHLGEKLVRACVKKEPLASTSELVSVLQNAKSVFCT